MCMQAREPAPPKGCDAWIPENYPDLSTSCPHRINHIYSFLHILHMRFFPRSISVHRYDLSLSCCFYTAYVKWVRLFKSPLFHKWREVVRSWSLPVISFSHILFVGEHLSEHRGPKLHL